VLPNLIKNKEKGVNKWVQLHYTTVHFVNQ
jgi:hypothetical protein